MDRKDVHLEVMSRKATIADNEAYCSKYHNEHPEEYFFESVKHQIRGRAKETTYVNTLMNTEAIMRLLWQTQI